MQPLSTSSSLVKPSMYFATPAPDPVVPLETWTQADPTFLCRTALKQYASMGLDTTMHKISGAPVRMLCRRTVHVFDADLLSFLGWHILAGPCRLMENHRKLTYHGSRTLPKFRCTIPHPWLSTPHADISLEADLRRTGHVQLLPYTRLMSNHLLLQCSTSRCNIAAANA